VERKNGIMVYGSSPLSLQECVDRLGCQAAICDRLHRSAWFTKLSATREEPSVPTSGDELRRLWEVRQTNDGGHAAPGGRPGGQEESGMSTDRFFQAQVFAEVFFSQEMDPISGDGFQFSLQGIRWKARGNGLPRAAAYDGFPLEEVHRIPKAGQVMGAGQAGRAGLAVAGSLAVEALPCQPHRPGSVDRQNRVRYGGKRSSPNQMDGLPRERVVLVLDEPMSRRTRLAAPTPEVVSTCCRRLYQLLSLGGEDRAEQTPLVYRR
jgi:hypothetical protein